MGSVQVPVPLPGTPGILIGGLPVGSGSLSMGVPWWQPFPPPIAAISWLVSTRRLLWFAWFEEFISTVLWVQSKLKKLRRRHRSPRAKGRAVPMGRPVFQRAFSRGPLQSPKSKGQGFSSGPLDSVGAGVSLGRQAPPTAANSSAVSVRMPAQPVAIAVSLVIKGIDMLGHSLSEEARAWCRGECGALEIQGSSSCRRAASCPCRWAGFERSRRPHIPFR
jgi:hypothetical protein